MTASAPAAKPKTQTYYELLGVSYYASADDVRKGYERRLTALDRMRPEGVDDDLPPQARERSDTIAAYSTLKDGARRNAYNATLAAANAELATVRQLENNGGLIAPGSRDGFAQQASTPASSRANAVDSSPIVREAPVDLRAAAQERDAERTRQRAARGDHVDDREWADDATLGVRYVAMTLDTMAAYFVIVIVALLFSRLFAKATPWYLLSATTLFLLTSGLTLLYYIWGECGRHRATPGKRLMGLQVVRLDGAAGVGVDGRRRDTAYDWLAATFF
jgi:RDD family